MYGIYKYIYTHVLATYIYIYTCFGDIFWLKIACCVWFKSLQLRLETTPVPTRSSLSGLGVLQMSET